MSRPVTSDGTSANRSSNTLSAAYWQFALAQLALGTWALVLRPADVHPLWGAAIVLAVIALLSLCSCSGC